MKNDLSAVGGALSSGGEAGRRGQRIGSCVKKHGRPAGVGAHTGMACIAVDS